MVPSPWHLTLTNLTATLPRWPRSFAWRSHKAPATVALVSASPAAMLKPWIASQNLKTRTVYVSWGFSRIRSDCSSQEGKLSDEMPEFPTIQKMPFGAFSRFKKKNIHLQRFSFQEFWYVSCFCANVAPAKWKWLFPDRFSRISLLFSFETWTWRGWLRLWYHGMEHDDGTVKRCPDWDFMEQRTLFQGESMGRRPRNDWTHPNHFKDLKSRNLNS